MVATQTKPSSKQNTSLRIRGQALDDRLGWESISAFAERSDHPSRSLAWLNILERAFKHRVILLVAESDEKVVGLLPLAVVESWLFGKYLVSLPYLNSSGVWTDDAFAETALVDLAVEMADELKVRHLELRHEHEVNHPKLTHTMTEKVMMRLMLPDSQDKLWIHFRPKLRNQIRKGQSQGFCVHWGGKEMVADFYRVFTRNMRDLGTPVFDIELFMAIADEMKDDAEFCVVRDKGQPIAAAMLTHGGGVTEVPSASSLREYRKSNANMLMYWSLLQRSVERGSDVFDFGRSTEDGNTYRFKKQWGAEPSPTYWQYYVREGDHHAMRPDNGKFSLAIRAWQHLPLSVANWIGPKIVRGIP